MEIYNLKNNRHLCWDDMLIDKNENTELVMHKPEKKEIALTTNKSWEGIHNGYARIMKVGDKYRLYYRASSDVCTIDGTYQKSIPPAFCVVESNDGKTFSYPKLGIYDVGGTDNNIIHFENKYVDNFSICYDENPDCPENEKYKALKMSSIDSKPVLILHTSGDGIHFVESRILDIEGDFDSYNVMLWDKESEQYFVFYRGSHLMPGETERIRADDDLYRVGDTNEIRDIRVATSPDFVHFTDHGQIKFIDDTGEDIQYYTNQTIKYPRANDMFISLAARYVDRRFDDDNFQEMPQWSKRGKIIEKYGRGGTAFTDTILMTSRDGFNFRRTDEAFFAPGVESDLNWWYGDCFFAYGMEETESDVPGAPNELSLYTGEGYRVQNVNFRRYTMRLDGFFSWYAKHKGGCVLTKPLTFEGNELEINFSTSVAGLVKISICDENGIMIEGYESKIIFGDSVNRKVKFEKPLSALRGKAVRLKIELKDAHLYSFKFN